MKILQISFGNSFRGVEKIELDWFLHMRKSFSFNFLVSSKHTFGEFSTLIQECGGKINNLNITPDTFINKIKYFKSILLFFYKNKYHIIHINSSSFLTSFMVVIIAKLTRQKKIIVHSHNYNASKRSFKLKKILFLLLNPLYRILTDIHISCSNCASYSLFSKRYIERNKITILKNGLDINKYKYNENIRKLLRKKHHIEDKKVFGHIGGFVLEKNHNKLLDIFNEIHKQDANSILILIGEGELRGSIIRKIKELKLVDSVIILGFLKDAALYFNAFDVFLFPSISEGFGMVAIEAQTNGLPTFCSDSIPSEVNISPLYNSFSIKDSSYQIASKIVSYKKKYDRAKAHLYTIKSGYDIEKSCKQLENIYRGLYHE